MGETNPFDADLIKSLVEKEISEGRVTANRLVDSRSTSFPYMTTEMTKLAQSLSHWIMDSQNDISELSMKKFQAVRVRSYKFMKLQEESSFALGLEIFALNDMMHAFRSATGAGGRIGLGAANKHLADLLGDSNSDIAFEWEDILKVVNFSEIDEISNFNDKNHPQVMWLLYVQIILFIALALDFPQPELSLELR